MSEDLLKTVEPSERATGTEKILAVIKTCDESTTSKSDAANSA